MMTEEMPDKILAWPDNRWCRVGTSIHLGGHVGPNPFINETLIQPLLGALEYYADDGNVDNFIARQALERFKGMKK